MLSSAVELHSKYPVQRFFDDSTHALKKSSGAFCAIATKSVVWKPTLSPQLQSGSKFCYKVAQLENYKVYKWRRNYKVAYNK